MPHPLSVLSVVEDDAGDSVFREDAYPVRVVDGREFGRIIVEALVRVRIGRAIGRNEQSLR